MCPGKSTEVSMGYIFVATEQKNTTSCGQLLNFQNLDVHNLFIDCVPNASFLDIPENKKGENFTFLPLLLNS